MKLNRIINWIMIILCLCLLAGAGMFVYDAAISYKISKDFVSVPLQFNPEDSSSAYQIHNAQVTVNGGFVKGIKKGKGGVESLVIRALSPLPSITVKGDVDSTVLLMIENINPDFYTKSIERDNLLITKIAANTVQLSITADSGKTVKIEPAQPMETEYAGKYKYIILGDNRDGYDTFEKIIQQVNGEKPVFVIDNGDLVFSGKSNQYRLFDQMVSKISTTLCTTMGNLFL
ncbi:MAG: hypothetical protein WBH44_07600 [Proteocatella sp.]